MIGESLADDRIEFQRVVETYGKYIVEIRSRDM